MFANPLDSKGRILRTDADDEVIKWYFSFTHITLDITRV